MNSSKSLKVSIFGEMYSLISNESEQHIIKAAEQVDHMMKEIAEASGVQDAKRLAILVALRLVSLMLSSERVTQESAEHYSKIASKIDQVLGS